MQKKQDTTRNVQPAEGHLVKLFIRSLLIIYENMQMTQKLEYVVQNLLDDIARSRD